MKIIRIFLMLISVIMLFVSCNDDNSENLIPNMSGEYKVISMLSSVAVDMNNDRLKSEDVLKEVTTPYVIDEISTSGTYYINSATASVVYCEKNNEGSIFVPYPYQYVIDEDKDSATLSWYVTQFPGFSFKLDLNGEIEVIEIFSEHQFADYGIASSAKRIDKDSFLVVVSAKLYDFKENKWVNTDVEIKCQRDTNNDEVEK